MKSDPDGLFYLGAGPIAALALGAALIPLRGITSAANLTVAFLVLTVAVAELGGLAASTATAVASALSLDFFLTRPYGRLAVDAKDDVIACVSLALCGLAVAGLSSARSRRLRQLETRVLRQEALRGLLADWNGADIAGPRVDRALRACVAVLPLSALVLRDPRDEAVWASGSGAGLRQLPASHALVASLSERHDPRDAPLPEAGMRIPLSAPSGRLLGRLDVWGDGAPADLETRRALLDLVRLLSILLAGERAETR